MQGAADLPLHPSESSRRSRPTQVPACSRPLGPFGEMEQTDFKLFSRWMGEREVWRAAGPKQLGASMSPAPSVPQPLGSSLRGAGAVPSSQPGWSI